MTRCPSSKWKQWAHEQDLNCILLLQQISIVSTWCGEANTLWGTNGRFGRGSAIFFVWSGFWMAGGSLAASEPPKPFPELTSSQFVNKQRVSSSEGVDPKNRRNFIFFVGLSMFSFFFSYLHRAALTYVFKTSSFQNHVLSKAPPQTKCLRKEMEHLFHRGMLRTLHTAVVLRMINKWENRKFLYVPAQRMPLTLYEYGTWNQMLYFPVVPVLLSFSLFLFFSFLGGAGLHVSRRNGPNYQGIDLPCPGGAVHERRPAQP